MTVKKISKGQYNYIKNQKGRSIMRTVLMFALSLSIFIFGMQYFDTKKNFCTVVAILGCLPASKSAVNMIMFMKARGCTEQAKDKISAYKGSLKQLYDMYFTSYEKNYQVSHIILHGSVICGYSEDAKCDVQACEKHMQAILKQGGCKKITVKIYKDIEKYCESILKLTEDALLSDKEIDEISANLLAVSL